MTKPLRARKDVHHLAVVTVVIRLHDPLHAAVLGPTVTATAAIPTAVAARVEAADLLVCDSAETGTKLT